MIKNIAEDVKKLIEKYGKEGAVDVLEQNAKKLTTKIDALTKEIEQAYDKYAIASSAATCGTVVITWAGKEVFCQLATGSKKAIELIANNIGRSIEELLDE